MIMPVRGPAASGQLFAGDARLSGGEARRRQRGRSAPRDRVGEHLGTLLAVPTLLFGAGVLEACSEPTCVATATCPTTSSVESDAAAPIAPAVEDAGADATAAVDVDADAAVPTFCDSKNVAFCWDFSKDGSGIPGATFFPHALGPSSVATESLVRFRSAPRGGRVSIGPPGEARNAWFGHDGTGAESHTRFTSALYVEQRPATGEIRSNSVGFVDEAANLVFLFQVSIGTTSATFTESKFNVATPQSPVETKTTPVALSPSIPTRRWIELAIEVSVGASKFARVTIDGVEAANVGVAYATPGRPRIIAGIGDAPANAGSANIFVDDVVLEYLP